MIAEDFEYAGEYLKDWGFMICSIENMNNIKKAISTLNFNTVSLINGKLFELTTSQYDNHLELNFQICKVIDNYQIESISLAEQREITRWLNRPTFHKFKILQPNWTDIYMEGSFNVSTIEFSGKVMFLELTFISNRPFALHEPITYRFQTSKEDKQFAFFDCSDEIGYIYPDIKITCLEDGDLEIHNSIEDRTTSIKNCSKNEIIVFSKELLFSSSNLKHNPNDFNFKFPRIANAYGIRKNVLTFSKLASVELTYTPYVKVVL